jgi:hypothetical protein
MQALPHCLKSMASVAHPVRQPVMLIESDEVSGSAAQYLQHLSVPVFIDVDSRRLTYTVPEHRTL